MSKIKDYYKDEDRALEEVTTDVREAISDALENNGIDPDRVSIFLPTLERGCKDLVNLEYAR
jgi:3-oxoacyl-[acyl-carrier-protein] synthase III